MDPNQGDFNVQKEAVAKELLDIMIKSLEEGSISADESETISRLIISSFDKAPDMYYVKATVEQIASRWPVFSSALLFFKTEAAENQDQAKIEETKKKLEEITDQTN